MGPRWYAQERRLREWASTPEAVAERREKMAARRVYDDAMELHEGRSVHAPAVVRPPDQPEERGSDMTATNPRTDDDFTFSPDHDGSLSIKSAVFQALGAASVCWDDMIGTGVFDSDRAKRIGDALVAEIASRSAATGEVDQERLYASPTADVWAEEFAKVRPDVDQGLMIGWFANAMETAINLHERKKARLSVPSEEA